MNDEEKQRGSFHVGAIQRDRTIVVPTTPVQFYLTVQRNGSVKFIVERDNDQVIDFEIDNQQREELIEYLADLME